MMKKKKGIPAPFVAATKDARFAGTFEVLVPAENRVRPFRVPLQFVTEDKAEAWIHSADGKEMIADILSGKLN